MPRTLHPEREQRTNDDQSDRRARFTCPACGDPAKEPELCSRCTDRGFTPLTAF